MRLIELLFFSSTLFGSDGFRFPLGPPSPEHDHECRRLRSFGKLIVIIGLVAPPRGLFHMSRRLRFTDTSHLLPPRMLLRNTFRAFGHRDYLIFWSGLFLGHTGTLVQATAQAWLIFQLTEFAVLSGSRGVMSRSATGALFGFGRSHCRPSRS